MIARARIIKVAFFTLASDAFGAVIKGALSVTHTDSTMPLVTKPFSFPESVNCYKGALAEEALLCYALRKSLNRDINIQCLYNAQGS
ncbi:hypothetical protein Y032_0042g523 [Ancylostoma ceylanicum]|uniref:Secreted protein n=1 Tax=Ancylostoma ceylanicum TaxID=53326 RepID=A0A016UEM7_9BILA|nr:hypothetical protein Y032_0042g523 [Ancylostoma ceylanicum]